MKLIPRLVPVIVVLLLSNCTNPASKEKKETIQVNTDTSSLPGDTTIQAAPATGTGTAVQFNTSAIRAAYDSFPVQLSGKPLFYISALKGLKVSVAYQGLKRLRFLALSPDKRLFATDMYDRSDNKKGRVYIFEGWDNDSMKFKNVIVYLDGLHNPNQVAFYDKYIYVAETGRLSRYLYDPSKNSPASAPELIASFPDYGLSYKYGGWHLTRSISFHHNKLYVSVGSSCNACIEKEDVRASVIEMDPDGRGQRIYARGLRNSVGIKWIGNQLWATGMGRDLIGPDRPEDLFQEVKQGADYGWPYYYQYRNRIYEDPEFKDSVKREGLQKPPLAFAGFKAHSAPLGFEYLDGFAHPSLKNSLVVCLHGSTSVWRQRGNSIVRLEGGNEYSEVITGFLKGKTEDKRLGRPCDVMMRDQNSFFFTDDLNGVLYFVQSTNPM